MSPDGDYYKKNKDGTYNHYNSIGNLIDENIDGEDKDKIEKKIKNGTLEILKHGKMYYQNVKSFEHF